MNATEKKARSLTWKVALTGALGAALIASALLLVTAQTGCGEEECLVYGENCGAAYKESEYGTTDIWCCEGLSCSESSLSGAYICK